MVTRPLVLMIVLCQVTFPVEKVTGVAFMNAAKTNFRILPMYPANVSFADGHRKEYVSFAWLMCHAIMGTWHGTISCLLEFAITPSYVIGILPFIDTAILFYSSSHRLATISSLHDVEIFYSRRLHSVPHLSACSKFYLSDVPKTLMANLRVLEYGRTVVYNQRT